MECSKSHSEADTVIPLLDSIPNTSNPTTKVALVPSKNVEEAWVQFEALNNILLNHVPKAFHDKVFVNNLPAGLTDQQVDSIPASNSATYALGLLQSFNPQDGDEDAQPQNWSHLMTVRLSYKAASLATTSTATPLASGRAVTSISSFSKDDIKSQNDQLKNYLSTADASQVAIEDLEDYYKQFQDAMANLTGKLKVDLGTLTGKVDSLQVGMVKHQESIDILKLDIQKQMELYNLCEKILWQ
jgi:hypothetical protein